MTVDIENHDAVSAQANPKTIKEIYPVDTQGKIKKAISMPSPAISA